MDTFDRTMQTIRQLDARFEELTGYQAFAYVSSPTPTSERYSFHDGTTVSGSKKAIAKMQGLVEEAENGGQFWW